MQDVKVMQTAECVKNLNKNAPDFFFLEELFLFLVVDNFLVEIAIV